VPYGSDEMADDYEKAYIEMALQKAGGNISRAAKLAGVGRRFLQKAMGRHGLRGRA
jgi:DNA-binding NtrC family response regulator